jgi:hypothetical protein
VLVPGETGWGQGVRGDGLCCRGLLVLTLDEEAGLEVGCLGLGTGREG